MVKNKAYYMVMSTCGKREEAEELARAILKKRLAACVQLSPITSFYEWKNRHYEEEETRMIIKTSAERYPELETFISRHHHYEVPEIIKLPMEGGLKDYLGWIDEVTGSGSKI